MRADHPQHRPWCRWGRGGAPVGCRGAQGGRAAGLSKDRPASWS